MRRLVGPPLLVLTLAAPPLLAAPQVSKVEPPAGEPAGAEAEPSQAIGTEG